MKLQKTPKLLFCHLMTTYEEEKEKTLDFTAAFLLAHFAKGNMSFCRPLSINFSNFNLLL